jgi:hypothetical protein
MGPASAGIVTPVIAVTNHRDPAHGFPRVIWREFHRQYRGLSDRMDCLERSKPSYRDFEAFVVKVKQSGFQLLA